MKYHPEFPERFGSPEDARAFCQTFFTWYNEDHRHSGIGFHTPADVHYGRAELVREQRGQVLSSVYAAHPERFVRRPPCRLSSRARFGSTSRVRRQTRRERRLRT